jgi:hypothetical protein
MLIRVLVLVVCATASAVAAPLGTVFVGVDSDGNSAFLRDDSRTALFIFDSNGAPVLRAECAPMGWRFVAGHRRWHRWWSTLDTGQPSAAALIAVLKGDRDWRDAEAGELYQMEQGCFALHGHVSTAQRLGKSFNGYRLYTNVGLSLREFHSPRSRARFVAVYRDGHTDWIVISRAVTVIDNSV